jgi:hypothetical protein
LGVWGVGGEGEARGEAGATVLLQLRYTVFRVV